MENNFDTIVAILTPLAVSAVGIIRVSGTKSHEIASKIFSKELKPKMINYGYIIDENKDKIDEVILLPFCAPHSYTGEDVVEIQTHGNPVIINQIVELIISKGARMAERGEFTKRAFLNHRIDMTQAEAVMDIISAKSEKSAHNALNNLQGYLKNNILEIKQELISLYSRLIASIDFPEDVAEVPLDDIVKICQEQSDKINLILKNAKSHDFIRDGINAALIGRPNAGKSSLFNALLNYNRAIVTEIEGTTRDTIKEAINIDGYLINFIDTAGIRDKDEADKVEKIGIENSIECIKQSEIILFLYEKNKNEIDSELINFTQNKKVLFIKTKSDIYDDESAADVVTCAINQKGIGELKEKIKEIISTLITDDTNYITNKRQQDCLKKCVLSLQNVIETAQSNELIDLCATDLKASILALDEIMGEVLTDKILDNIFDNFCIGK